MLVSIFILSVSAMFTEALVGANYALAMIFITTQVITLNMDWLQANYRFSSPCQECWML